MRKGEQKSQNSQEAPLIEIIDKLKREKAQNELYMETSDLKLIKDRSPNAIISHKKYANPHSRSQPSIGTVVIHSKTAPISG